MTKTQNVVWDLDFQSMFEEIPQVRFIGVCTTEGKLLEAQYRNGITPLLTSRGLQFAVIKSAIRATTRIGENEEVGKPIYSVTKYEHVKRATIPFGDNLLLLVSFEKNQVESVIIEKVLEFLHKN